MDETVDKDDGETEKCGREPEGLSGWSPIWAESCFQEEEHDEEDPGLRVIGQIAEEAAGAVSQDDDLEAGIHVRLDAFVPKRRIEPVWVGAVGELPVAEDSGGLKKLLLGMLQMDFCGSEA